MTSAVIAYGAGIGGGGGVVADDVAGVIMPDMAVVKHFSNSAPPPEIAIRSDFPEAWIFASFDVKCVRLSSEALLKIYRQPACL